MAWWTTAAIAIGTVVSAAGAAQQQRAAQSQAQFQAGLARNNAIIAQQNAADAKDRGKADAEEHRDRVEQQKGAVKADQAGSGFLVDDPGSTNVDLLADVAEAGALDIRRIEQNTDREVRRALIQGDNFTAQASLYGIKASSYSPGTAAAGTLLSGAAQAGANYKSMSSPVKTT